MVLRSGEPTHVSVSARHQHLEVVSLDIFSLPYLTTGFKAKDLEIFFFVTTTKPN
jgi:hypothetical protein